MLIALYERVVGLYASLVGINAYHQPVVEAGKKADTAVIVLKNKLQAALTAAPDETFTAEALPSQFDGDAELVELVKRASVEQSIAAGRWDSGSGSYRDKLRDEQRSVSLEQADKMVTSADMTTRLVDEAIALITTEPDNLNHYRTVVGGLHSLGRFDDALAWLAMDGAIPSDALREVDDGSERAAS